MKKLIFALMLLIFSLEVISQKVGIGTNNPVTTLDVRGSFRSEASYTTASQPPTAAQTYTMINGNTISWSLEDSIARVFDPGGISGNYLPNLAASFLASSNYTPGSVLELLIENIELATGDSLIIYDGTVSTDPVLMRLGNGYSGAAIVLNFSANSGYCIFKSNSDATVAAGFSLLFKRKYINTTVPDPVVTGNSLVFYPNKWAIRAGFLNASTIGNNSTAFGDNVTASNSYSIAIGDRASATGFGSTAIGTATKASGIFYATALGAGTTASGYSSSTAFGNGTEASASYATAMGYYTKATGLASAALGYSSIASGSYSTSLGSETEASGHYSLAIGLGTRAKAYTLAMGRYNTISTHSENAWLAGEIAFIIGDGTSSTARSNAFYIYKNGDAWMQGTLTQNSDARLKTNIHPLSNALDKIKKINGYTYYWKDSTSQPGLYTGVLAQEVQQAIPELVTPNTEGQLAVNYNGLIPYLIESIKLLEKQNILLEEKLGKLEKRRKKRGK